MKEFVWVTRFMLKGLAESSKVSPSGRRQGERGSKEVPEAFSFTMKKVVPRFK